MDGGVALLLLLFLYCDILFWKEPFKGDDSGDDNFPKSSADRDQAFCEILLKSPSPPERVGESEVGEGKECDMSRDPLDDRSSTDLVALMSEYKMKQGEQDNITYLLALEDIFESD